MIDTGKDTYLPTNNYPNGMCTAATSRGKQTMPALTSAVPPRHASLGRPGATWPQHRSPGSECSCPHRHTYISLNTAVGGDAAASFLTGMECGCCWGWRVPSAQGMQSWTRQCVKHTSTPGRTAASPVRGGSLRCTQVKATTPLRAPVAAATWALLACGLALRRKGLQHVRCNNWQHVLKDEVVHQLAFEAVICWVLKLKVALVRDNEHLIHVPSAALDYFFQGVWRSEAI